MSKKFLVITKQDWWATFLTLLITCAGTFLLFWSPTQYAESLRNAYSSSEALSILNYREYAEIYGSTTASITMAWTIAAILQIILYIFSGWLVTKMAKNKAWYFPVLPIILLAFLFLLYLIASPLISEFPVKVTEIISFISLPLFFPLLFMFIPSLADFWGSGILVWTTLAITGGMIAKHVSLKIK